MGYYGIRILQFTHCSATKIIIQNVNLRVMFYDFMRVVVLLGVDILNVVLLTDLLIVEAPLKM
jgi:hypothetical protein